MPDIDAWAGDSFPLSGWLDDIDPAVDEARIIADKSTSITITRAGAALSAQTVRLEELRRRERIVSEGGVTAYVDALVIGYKGHPTISDTDIQRGDRFAANGEYYEVVILVPGLVNTVQAYAQVRA